MRRQTPATTRCVNCVYRNEPATQFPTPALNDWSNKRALMGHDLFSTPFLKYSKSGIEMMGSKPSEEIGGSVRGALQRRMRPSLLGSMNATC